MSFCSRIHGHDIKSQINTHFHVMFLFTILYINVYCFVSVQTYLVHPISVLSIDYKPRFINFFCTWLHCEYSRFFSYQAFLFFVADTGRVATKWGLAIGALYLSVLSVGRMKCSKLAWPINYCHIGVSTDIAALSCHSEQDWCWNQYKRVWYWNHYKAVLHWNSVKLELLQRTVALHNIWELYEWDIYHWLFWKGKHAAKAICYKSFSTKGNLCVKGLKPELSTGLSST